MEVTVECSPISPGGHNVIPEDAMTPSQRQEAFDAGDIAGQAAGSCKKILRVEDRRYIHLEPISAGTIMTGLPEISFGMPRCR